MLRKIGISIATTFTLISLSGGSCHTAPKIITSEGLSAANIFPEYSIYEHNNGEQNKCYFIVEPPELILDSRNVVSLTPPANVTFQGKTLSLVKASANKFPCQHQIVEFVLTDNKGGKRIDRFNLQQAKFSVSKITADRSQDLQIQLRDFIYRKDIDLLDLSLIIGRGAEESRELEIRSFSKNPAENEHKSQPMFDRDTQTLILPAEMLKNIKHQTTSIRLAAKVTIINQHPRSSISLKTLTYSYHIPSIEVELK